MLFNIDFRDLHALIVCASSSRMGAICLQGAHHCAQKSSRTGWLAWSTSLSKEASLTVLTALCALIGRADIPDLRELLILLARCIRKRGFEVVCEAQTAQAARLTEYSLLSASEIGTRADVAVVIGGDGTMLGMGRQLAPYGTPLIGVNRGRLGFVTDIPIRDMLRVVPVMLEGRFEREERTLLDARVLRKGSPVYHALAFNDVVVNRSGISGMVELSVYVDDCFMYRQRSDGLIAATPTGSTAYALSSQGPILHPQLAGIVLVPIAPHTLSNRPIVLPDHARIAIQIVDGREMNVNFDTQSLTQLQLKDVVEVSRSRYTVPFLHPAGHSHYATLRNKLGWHEHPARGARCPDLN